MTELAALHLGSVVPFELTLGTRYELGMSWLCPALGVTLSASALSSRLDPRVRRRDVPQCDPRAAAKMINPKNSAPTSAATAARTPTC